VVQGSAGYVSGVSHTIRKWPDAGGVATTGRYTETALRITLADALVPGGLAHIDLASAVVGPNRVVLTPATA
jgi:hypothetical protein